MASARPAADTYTAVQLLLEGEGRGVQVWLRRGERGRGGASLEGGRTRGRECSC